MSTRIQSINIYLMGEVRLVEQSLRHMEEMITIGWFVAHMVNIDKGMIAVTFERNDGKRDTIPIPTERKTLPKKSWDDV